MHRFFSLCDHLWHRTPISEAEMQSSLQVRMNMIITGAEEVTRGWRPVCLN